MTRAPVVVEMMYAVLCRHEHNPRRGRTARQVGTFAPGELGR